MNEKAETVAQSDEWNQFHAIKVKGSYPKWPNEPMLKTLFGSYSSTTVKPQSNWRVLDVGCGFGNNLVPFAELGCECHGVEIHKDICELSEEVLEARGYKTKVQTGTNRSLPYPDGYFDLLLSVATIHYEGTEENILAALREFRRVVRPGGLVYIATVGPSHEIYRRAEMLGNHRYRIRDYDFRNGQEFFFFDNERYLSYYCAQVFQGVEVGRIKEELFGFHVDHLIALCRSGNAEL